MPPILHSAGGSASPALSDGTLGDGAGIKHRKERRERGDALRQAREEIAQLETERVRLSAEVMEGRPGALEEDERLRQRIAELGHWLLEAEKEGHGSETPSYEDVLHALRVRLAGNPQLRYQPTEDIGHDLMTNRYLSTEPDPALVRRALAEIADNGGAL